MKNLPVGHAPRPRSSLASLLAPPSPRSSLLARLAPRSSLASLLAPRSPRSSLLPRLAPRCLLASLLAPRPPRSSLLARRASRSSLGSPEFFLSRAEVLVRGRQARSWSLRGSQLLGAPRASQPPPLPAFPVSRASYFGFPIDSLRLKEAQDSREGRGGQLFKVESNFAKLKVTLKSYFP